MPDTPGEIADGLEGDFRRLLTAVDVLGPRQRVGDWTVQQMMAHVAAWNQEILAALAEVLAGQPAHYAGWDEDEYNRAVASRSQSVPWESVRAQALAAHAALVARVRGLSEKQWRRRASGRWPDGSPMTAASVLGYVYKGGSHYAGHAAELEELLKR